MDQAVCMDHLHGGGERRGVLPVPPAQAAELKGKNRPQTLAAPKQTVFHGLVEIFLGRVVELRVEILQIGFHVLPVFSASRVKAHPESPPLQGCRPGRS